MSNLQERKERFLRDPLPLRLGNLSSSLNRISIIPSNTGRAEIIAECRYFIEWTVAEVEPEVAEVLAEIQHQLSSAKDKLEQPGELELLKVKAKEWSNVVLNHSGLLQEQ
jgi:hypothetical protein